MHPQDCVQQITSLSQKDEVVGKLKAGDYFSLTYDDILSFLEDLESGELEKRCAIEDLQWINPFLASLAREGMLPGETEYNQEIERDIQELLLGDNDLDEKLLSLGSDDRYMFIPTVFNSYGEVILCKKGWWHKRWDSTKKFTKKHKKAVIIATAVVVAVVAVVTVVGVAAAVPAAGAAAAGAAASGSEGNGHHKAKDEPTPASPNSSIPMSPANEAILKSTINDHLSSIIDITAKEQFFSSFGDPKPHGEISLRESGRLLGSLFAHESFRNLKPLFSDRPNETSGWQNQFNPSEKNNDMAFDFGHREIDHKFNTDYSSLFSDPNNATDFNSLFYQTRGEKALANGYFEQAAQDFGKAIELDPVNPFTYLDRGVAYFGLGEYDRSLEDYHSYATQTQKTHPLSIPEFSLGFAKGLPKGIYDSGEGLLLFLADVVKHPVNTGAQMWEALTMLSHLAKTEQWSVLGEALAPEVHQLIKEWDTTPSDKRGELAGYAFGKYGADIIIPGVVAKTVSNGIKGAQELSAVQRSLLAAEKNLLLETISSLEGTSRIAEVVQLEKQVSRWLGDGTKSIRNAAGDPIFISKDGLRKVRFDFNRPFPHENPHLHFEQLVDGEWKEISRVYPSDVPHN